MIVELDNKEISFKYSLQDTDLEISERGIVGQERALKALRTGLKTNRNGYNLFISGEMGTGKLTSVRQEAENCTDEEMIKDVVYLANPSNPYFPISLCLNKGDGNKLKALLSSATIENYQMVLEEVKNQIPEATRYAALLSKSTFNENNYKVNLVLDRSLDNKRPFIVESHPTFENLFGYADKSEDIPHLAIHIGSYAKASGGFLVLTAAEVLSQKGLWDAIKRHLDSTAMALSTSGVQGSLGKDERIRPEPIALPTKVILLGSEDIFDELCDKDEGFLRLFKVAPQFDYMMEANKENILGTIAYLKKINPNITKEACEEALRYSSSICESRDQLTCQLTLLGDLISEAALYSNGKITGDDIKRAIKDRAELTDLLEDRINQEIKSGELLVSTSGSKVGIINGLAVMDRGAASFGTPAVISATVAPGSEGIVNIEHEAGLSGEIHDKGILILQGYLRKNYARSFPLSIYAGLCFEQNYSEVDGDSASSSELYALLSAIGELPVRQDIAITGSVNQMGILQPVSGINEKITGFYHTCKLCGFTGTQGVIIPKQNIRSLILPYEVEDDIKKGNFHLWALSTIEEGMELLTGLPSSSRDKRGLFKPGSFNRVIEDNLKKLYESGKGN
ncbi:AAA family ATPase [Bullifex porci]|uniref:endopeptidase La n=1 Tax=Bullifex porci TaxID=2606638 RepID=A0A7X2PDM6_9SPIO|nr:AAA family ATPase [Bullifex porci]MDD7255505.1 AAA family ATPase [Bullifex porci]MDY2740874.1 AAA family ATPase [Bullifex porci]MSU06944.1 AAA family ATPase [Bullifex porci]